MDLKWIFLGGYFFFSAQSPLPTIPASEAGKHIGERAMVCGAVSGKHTADRIKGTPTFLDIDGSYPNQVFTVVVWGDDAARVGQLPSSGKLCVTGQIASFHGKPQIVLHDAGSWTSQ